TARPSRRREGAEASSRREVQRSSNRRTKPPDEAKRSKLAGAFPAASKPPSLTAREDQSEEVADVR
ncbi:unnamed protein product, partial [Cochlearia groenlandica]